MAHVSEHEAEEQTVGDEHEDARVGLAVGGGTVHLHEGREDAREEAVPELDGDVAYVRVAGLVQRADAAERVGRGLELFKLARGQPAAEVELVGAHRGEAAQVEALAHVAEVGVAGERPLPLAFPERVELLCKVRGLAAGVLGLGTQRGYARRRHAGEPRGVGRGLALKAEVAQPVLLEYGLAGQGQQYAADPSLLEAGAEEEHPVLVLGLGADLVPDVLLDGAEVELHVLNAQQLLQVH